MLARGRPKEKRKLQAGRGNSVLLLPLPVLQPVLRLLATAAAAPALPPQAYTRLTHL
jgi:hypothetical protein